MKPWSDARKRIVVYVSASLALTVGLHLWHYRNGSPPVTQVNVSGAQLTLVIVALIGIGVAIGRRWPK